MNTKICPHCGASMRSNWHHFTLGLLGAFKQFVDYLRVPSLREWDSAHLQRDLDLTKSEYNNFQKLRYFGLVEKAEEKGYWNLTQLGKDFYLDKQGIPEKVLTYRNAVVKLSTREIWYSEFRDRARKKGTKFQEVFPSESVKETKTTASGLF